VRLVDQLAAVRLGPELARTVAAGPDLAGHSDARPRARSSPRTTTARRDRGAGGPADGGARPGGTADGGAWPGGPTDGVAGDLGARRLGEEGGAPIVAGRWRSHGVLGPHRGPRRRPKAATIGEEGKRRRGSREEEGKRTLYCVRCWRREVMGHGPFYCAQRKPTNASWVWVGSVGDSLKRYLVELEVL